MENGLVGRWFLRKVWSESLLQNIPQGGKIAEDLGHGMYRVEFLDLMVAGFESCKVFNVQSMEGWRLFDSEAEWLRMAGRYVSEWQKDFQVA